MEHLCKEIQENVIVDFDSDEIQDMIKAVDILMNRFVEELRVSFPKTQIDRLVLCGSMAEKTRIWKTDRMCDIEFDYLAVMKSWPGYGDTRFEYNFPGEMKVKVEVTDPQSVRGEFVNLDTKANNTFQINLLKCMYDACSRNYCTLGEVKLYSRDKIVTGCQFCTVHMSSGSLICLDTSTWTDYLRRNGYMDKKLNFLWLSKSESIEIPLTEENFRQNVYIYINFYLSETGSTTEFGLDFQWKTKKMKTIGVDVDFHPVLETDPAKIDQKNQAYLIYRNEKYLIFPKSNRCDGNYWRISTCEEELETLNKTSKEHRLAFSILKFLLTTHSFFSHSHIKSYEAKTAVIRHVRRCKTPGIGAHVCLLYIIHDIAICKGSGWMTHPMLHLNLYEVLEMKSQMHIASVIWLKECAVLLANQRGEYTVSDLYNDLNALSNILVSTITHRITFSDDPFPELRREFHHFINKRKKDAPNKVLVNMAMHLRRKERLRTLQSFLIDSNVKKARGIPRFGICEYEYIY